MTSSTLPPASYCQFLGCFSFQDISNNQYLNNSSFQPTAMPAWNAPNTTYFNVWILVWQDSNNTTSYVALQSQSAVGGATGFWVTATQSGNTYSLGLSNTNIMGAAWFTGPADAISFGSNFNLSLLINQNPATLAPVVNQSGTYRGVSGGKPSTFIGSGMGGGNWGPYNTPSLYEGIRFDYADMTNLELPEWMSGKDFTDGSFRYTNLNRLIMSQTNITNCDFTGANWANAQLQGLNIGGATLTNLDTTTLANCGVWMAGTGPEMTNFNGSNVDFSVFFNPNTNVYDVSYCDLSGATVYNFPTNLNAFQNMLAVGANLSRLNFSGYNLSGANFSNATLTYTNFNKANLDNANLSAANATFANFIGASMNACNMSGIIAGGSAQGSGALFNGALMQNVNLNNANLTGANFSGAYIFGGSTTMTNINTESVIFTNSYMANLSIQNCTLLGCNWDGACLVATNFSNTNFGPTLAGEVGTSMVGTFLQGANFTGAMLANVDMNKAGVSFGNGGITINCSGYFLPQSQVYNATAGLNQNTLAATTTCPNGEPFSQWNPSSGQNGINAMLTANPPAPTTWYCPK
ncbi:MAG: pentapeptide repeat-containing protein [Bacteroidia bacterium]|nr:pentapeptide repeat-containing protein [Bacteroidia bacterium]